jgi:signal transduction histidine kinase
MSKLLAFWLFLSLSMGIICAQENTVLEKLKGEIRQATYYDSATVFKKGNQAILIARKQGLISEIGTIYQYYGNFCYFSGKVEKANDYYLKSILIGKEQNDLKLVNSSRIRQTFIEMDTNVLNAEIHFKQLLREAEKNKYIENQIEIHNGLGILFESKLMRDQALNHYQLGLKLAEKHRKDYMTSYLLNNIALLKLNNQNLDGAKHDLERALGLAKNLNEPRIKLNLLNNLGLINQEKKDWKNAIIHYKQTVQEAKKIGFPSGIMAAYINLSSNYIQNNQFQLARACADSALALEPLNANPEYKVAVHLLNLLYAVRIQNIPLSEVYLKKVKTMLSYYPNPNQLLEAMHLEVDLLEIKQEFKQAFNLQKRIQQYSDSIVSVSNQNELTKLQTIYGKERMENELEEVKNKNKLLSTENQLKNAENKYYLTLGIVLVLLIGGVVYISYSRKTKAVKSFFSKKLLEQIDEERSRISKDLHDDIGQSLSIIKSKISLFNSGKIESIEHMENEVGEIIEQTRHLSHELHPSGIEKIGLVTSINTMLNKTQEATGIITSLDWELEDHLFNLQVQTHIFRIFQECANNTIKHSQATALKISGKRQKDSIKLSYQDNGKGIHTTDISSGIGLMTIRERVDMIHGKMELKNTENSGFELIIKINQP